jgi:hypothetical protein
MDRRAFLQSAAAAALTATIPAAGATAPPPATKEKMIGIQVGAASFVDEGTEKVLDEFQQDRYGKPAETISATRSLGSNSSGSMVTAFCASTSAGANCPAEVRS